MQAIVGEVSDEIEIKNGKSIADKTGSTHGTARTGRDR